VPCVKNVSRTSRSDQSNSRERSATSNGPIRSFICCFESYDFERPHSSPPHIDVETAFASLRGRARAFNGRFRCCWWIDEAPRRTAFLAPLSFRRGFLPDRSR
jgi:hypothetical protein